MLDTVENHKATRSLLTQSQELQKCETFLVPSVVGSGTGD